MWWMYANSATIVTLWASLNAVLDDPATYKPVYEFIVLGVVPGTSVEISFMSSLLMLLCLVLGALLVTEKGSRHRRAAAAHS